MRLKPTVLLVGIGLCAICALFPPRGLIKPTDYGFMIRARSVSPLVIVPRAFLFSSDFALYQTVNDGVHYSYPVEVDSGRLLAELVLVGALTGILLLAPILPKERACVPVSTMSKEMP